MAIISSDNYLLHVIDMNRTNPFYKVLDNDFRGVFIETAKLELKKRNLRNEVFDEKRLDNALDRIRNRQDMAEFTIPALIRILKEYRDLLNDGIIKRIEDTLIGFRYWLDEPGNIEACYFTENHQVLYHSAEIIVGEMFPDTLFPSDGKTGAQHAAHGTVFLNRWLNWRTRFGFSEWLTNYYAEDLIALLGIMHYAEDEMLRRRSSKIFETLLFDIAVNTFQGHWAGCQGRTYARYLVEPAHEAISAIARLCWGEGDIDGGLSDCAVMMAIYNYKCPEVIKDVALDNMTAVINKERMSINACDAKRFGVDPADFDNIMFFWGMQTYCSRKVIENSKKVITPTNWMNERLNAFSEHYELCDLAHIPTDDDPDFTAMTQADIYTYRTKDYIMSCAQDFRRGKQGYQQHIWGAFLGGRTRVFTNHMGSSEYMERPNFLAGNAYLPRAVQHENVLISIYRVPICYIQYFETHAYFPQHEFDETTEKNGWVFGRKNNGYIALKSMNPASWKDQDPNLFKAVYGENWESYYLNATKPYIYHCNGHANVWVAEMGNKDKNGSFEKFIAGFESAEITGGTWICEYNSPSLGKIGFGWNSDFTVNDEVISIHDYPRYDNPYCMAEFGTTSLHIKYGSNELIIDNEECLP